MLRYRMKYTDQGATLYDHNTACKSPISTKAAQLGLQIIEVAPAA
jgi:hypothetical protein